MTNLRAAGTCSIVSIAPLNFGANIIPGKAGATIKSSTTISVSCKVGTHYLVSLDRGLHPINKSGERQLVTETSNLTYEVFQDSARTKPWGDGTKGGVAGFGDGSVQQFPVYASVYLPPNATFGSHSDSLTVTVTVSPF